MTGCRIARPANLSVGLSFSTAICPLTRTSFVPLAQAIYSATGLPADVLRLPDRGYLKPGFFADVVVFDPATFRDTATYDKPLQWASGAKLVLVNGQVAVENEKPTDKLSGRAIRHPVKQH